MSTERNIWWRNLEYLADGQKTCEVVIYKYLSDPPTFKGWFEITFPEIDPFDGEEYDDVIQGGLWLEARTDGTFELMDYDGVYELPLPVVRQLEAWGIHMEPEFYP